MVQYPSSIPGEHVYLPNTELHNDTSGAKRIEQMPSIHAISQQGNSMDCSMVNNAFSPWFLDLSEFGQHVDNKSQSALPKGAHVWRDLGNRVITKPTYASVTRSNIIDEVPVNTFPVLRDTSVLHLRYIIIVSPFSYNTGKRKRPSEYNLPTLHRHRIVNTNALITDNKSSPLTGTISRLQSQTEPQTDSSHGTANGQFTFFTPAGDEVVGHPCSEMAANSSTRNGSGDFTVDAILDKTATTEGPTNSKKDTPELNRAELPSENTLASNR
ncbi:hypothetical protein Tco_1514890 [Tanacetum coccineum]